MIEAAGHRRRGRRTRAALAPTGMVWAMPAHPHPDAAEVSDTPLAPTPRQADGAPSPDSTAASVVPAHAEPSPGGADESVETPWWQDDGMPWKHKPGRADYWCMGWIGFLGLFSLAMLPLRGWLLGLDPPVLLGVTGSRTGAAATGALASVGHAPHWVWWMLLGSVMSVKFDWIYWWAGKLWGRGMIEVWSAQSERAQRRYARAEQWAVKLGWLGILLAYVPIPLPIMPVVFVLAGASRMRLWVFMAVNLVAATVWNLGYFGLGWMVGDPIVGVLKQYAKIAGWVAIALMVVILVPIFRRSGHRA